MTLFNHFQRGFIALRARARPISLPFPTILENGIQYGQEHPQDVEFLACGIMASSSGILPLLCDQKLDMERFIGFDLAVFVASTASYGYWNRKNIRENGAIVLGVCSIAGFLAFLAHPVPLDDVPPFMPFCLAIGLLMAVSVVPWLKRTYHRDNRLTLHNFIEVGGGRRPAGSNEGTLDPNSTRSDEESRGSTSRLFRQESDPFDLAYIGHNFPLFPMPGRRHSANDIDLEQGPQQHSSTSSEVGSSEGNSEDNLL